MKTRHDGDCSIYSPLKNGCPEDGICTCGYGHQRLGEGDRSEMYSKELEQKLEVSKMTDDEREKRLNNFLDQFGEDN